jgi:hypothetical protein
MTNIEIEMVERAIAHEIIKLALAHGYSVTVHDDYEGQGEDTVFHSRDMTEITNALRTTEGDQLRIHGVDGRLFGIVTLIYGNEGFDVIADYSSKLECFLAGIEQRVEQVSEEIAA